MTPHLEPWLCALAGTGFPNARPLEASGWEARLVEVFQHGLAGLLGHAWEEGAITLDNEALDQLEGRLEAEAVLGVRLEAELLRLAPILERARAVVLKGPVLAHGAYPSPQLRSFTDLDVLVSGRALPDAITALVDVGYRRPRPDPSRGFTRRVAKATALQHPEGLVVDLHRTLTTGSSGERVDVDEVLAGRWVMRVGSGDIPAPRWEAHLVEAALHAVVGHGLTRAISVRDVAQVSALPDLDAEQVIDLAHRWRLARPVVLGLRAARDGLGASLPPVLDAWAFDPTTTNLATRRPASGAARSARSRMEEVRRSSPRRRAALLRALVAPDPTFLRWKYGDQRLPTLYLRRWRDLYHRTDDARVTS